MITADGWVDWAVRLPSTSNKVNPGRNAGKGLFMHSAEGYASVLLSPVSQYGYNGSHSWHFTNTFDGTLYQHYPITSNCWHATAANNSYLGMENEGYAPKEPTLTDAQVHTAARLIGDLAQHFNWQPSRPASPTDITHTLWEHKEVVRLGGSSTACPSGRIPWDKILALLSPPEEDILANLNGDGSSRIVAEGNQIVIYNLGVPVLKIGSPDGQYPGQISKNFGGEFVYLLGVNTPQTPPLWPSGGNAAWDTVPGD